MAVGNDFSILIDLEFEKASEVGGKLEQTLNSIPKDLRKLELDLGIDKATTNLLSKMGDLLGNIKSNLNGVNTGDLKKVVNDVKNIEQVKMEGIFDKVDPIEDAKKLVSKYKKADDIITEALDTIGARRKMFKFTKQSLKMGDYDSLEPVIEEGVAKQARDSAKRAKEMYEEEFGKVIDGIKLNGKALQLNPKALGLDAEGLSFIKKELQSVITLTDKSKVSVDSWMQDFEKGLGRGIINQDLTIDDKLTQLAGFIREFRDVKAGRMSSPFDGFDKDKAMEHAEDTLYEVVNTMKKYNDAKKLLDDKGIDTSIKEETDAIEKQQEALKDVNKEIEESIELKKSDAKVSKKIDKYNDKGLRVEHIDEYKDKLGNSTKETTRYSRDEDGNVDGKYTTTTITKDLEKLEKVTDDVTKSQQKLYRELVKLPEIKRLDFVDKIEGIDADTKGSFIEKLKMDIQDAIKEYNNLQKAQEKLKKDTDSIEALKTGLTSKVDKLYKSEAIPEDLIDALDRRVSSLGASSSKTEIARVKTELSALNDLEKDSLKITKESKKLREQETREIFKQQDAESKSLDALKAKQEAMMSVLQKAKNAGGVGNNSIIEDMEKKINSITPETMSSKTDMGRLERELKSVLELNKEITSEIKRQEKAEEDKANAIRKMSNKYKNLESKNNYGDLMNAGDVKPFVDKYEKAMNALKNSNMDSVKRDIKEVEFSFQELEVAIRDSAKALKLSQRDVTSFGEGLKTMAEKAGMFRLVYEGMNMIERSFEDGIRAVFELDSAFTTLRTTMDNITNASLNDMLSQSQQMAKDLSALTTDVLEAVKTFANSNESVQGIMNKTAPAIILSNLTGLSTADTVNIVQSATKQYEDLADGSEKSAMRVADAMVSISRSLGMDFSKGVKEMGASVEIIGALADQVGMTLEETMAYISATMETTRMSGSEIATSLKTIISRTMRIKDPSEGVGEKEMLKAERALNDIGVSIRGAGGDMRGFLDIMKDVTKEWENMSETEQMALGDALGGARQLSVVLTMIKNQGRADELLGIAKDGEGSALNAQAEYAESLNGKLKELKNTAQIFWQNLIDSESIKGLIDGMITIIDIADKMVDMFGSIGFSIGALASSFVIFTNNPIKDFLISFDKETNTVNSGLMNLIGTMTNGESGLKNLGNSFKGAGSAMDVVRMGAINASSGFKAIGASAEFAKIKVMALQAVMTVGLSFAIGFVVQSLVNMTDALITTKDEMEELNRESTNFVKSTTKETAKAIELLEEKKDLEHRIGNTGNLEKRKELEEELLGIQKELASILPESSTGFDNEGNLITTSNELIAEQIRLKKESMRLEAEKFAQENSNISKQVSDLDYFKKKYEGMQLAKARGEKYKDRDGTTQKVTTEALEAIHGKVTELSTVLQQANMHYQSLVKSGYSDEAIKGMGFDVEALKAYNEQLGMSTDLLNENSESKEKNGQAWQKYMTDDMANVPTFDKNMFGNVDDATKAFSDAISKAEELRGIVKEINKENGMTGDIIARVSKEYPMIGSKITDAKATQEFLNQKIEEQVKIQQQAYHAMAGDDAEYYKSKIANNDEAKKAVNDMFNQFVADGQEAYNIDLEGFTTLNAMKDGLQKDFGTAVSTWLEDYVGESIGGYEADFFNFKSLAEAKAKILWALNEEVKKINQNMKLVGVSLQAYNTLDKFGLSSLTDGLRDNAQKELDALQKEQDRLNNAINSVDGKFQEINTSIGGAVGGFQGFDSGGIGSGSGSGGKKGGSGSKQEVADMEDLRDRYYEVNHRLEQINNSLAKNKALQSTAKGKEKIKLLNEEIKLLEEKKKALQNVAKEQEKERKELEKTLKNNGFSIDKNGLITNYQAQLKKLQDQANSLSGDAKKAKQEAVKALDEAIKKYQQLVNSQMSSTQNDIISIDKDIQNALNQQLDVYKDVYGKVTDIVRKEIEKRKKMYQEEFDKKMKLLKDERDAYNKQNEKEDYEERLGDERKKLDELQQLINDASRDLSQSG